MELLQLRDPDLESYYNLKSLNPGQSWATDSISHWDNTQIPELNDDNAYSVLKLLMDQQQSTTYRDSDILSSNNDLNLDLNSIKDPLRGNDNKNLLHVLQNCHNRDELLKYLINNKKFDVKKFLRDIHSMDTFDDLTNSLDSLDQSIQLQANDLKSLVQQNFNKYVKIKNKLDQVYKQFSENSVETDKTTTTNLGVNQLNDKVDESIRAITLKLNPILQTSQKINNYKLTKQFIEENKNYFNLPNLLNKYLSNNDYQPFIQEYAKGYENYLELNDYYSKLDSKPKIIQQIWSEVDRIVQSYRQQTWDALINPNTNNISNDNNNKFFESQSFFLPLISKLLDLKIEENPIVKFINIRLNNFEKEFKQTAKNLTDKIVIAQNNILRIHTTDNSSSNDTDDNDGVNLSYYLSINELFTPIFTNDNDTDSLQRDGGVSSTTNSSNDTLPLRFNEADSSLNNHKKRSTTNSPGKIFKPSNLLNGLTDSPIIIEMWLIILRYVNELGSLTIRFIELWEHIENFLNGTYQTTLINDKKKDNILVGDLNAMDNFNKILKVNDMEITNIKNRGDSLVSMICNEFNVFFKSSQDSLILQTSNNINVNNGIPEDFGFIPPRANGLSCLRYIPMIIEPFIKYMTQMAQLNISTNSIEQTQQVVNMAMERCVKAISATKLRDNTKFYKLENWAIDTMVQEFNNDSSYEYGITQFPNIVLAYQQYSIRTTRNILFAFEKLPVLNNISIIGYPSNQIMADIEIQQIMSMESVLTATMKNATKDKDNPRTSQTLLTLTNLQYIREHTFPEILRFFDDAFDCNLQKKQLEIFNLLNKMENSIFNNYVSNLKVNLNDILDTKFDQIDLITHTSNSFRVSDYILEALMLLVTVHSDCFRIGPQLINKIIQDTQLFIARYLFEKFKPFIGKISSDGLLQICVDLIFFQKVLGNLLEEETKTTLMANLQHCFQNKVERLEKCIRDIDPIVNSNLKRTSVQFAALQSH